MFRTRPTLATLLLLLLPALAAARDWKEIKSEFQRKYASTDWAQKADAVRVLGEADNAQACALLAQVIQSGDADVARLIPQVEQTNKRLKPFAGLTRFTTDQLNEKKRLTTLLAKQNAEWRGWEKVGDAALDTLGRIKGPAAKRWLVETGLKRGPWRLRAAVARALGGIGGDDVVAPLIAGVKAADPRVATACIDALGRLKVKQAAGEIALKLKHARWQVRAAVARALGEIGAVAHVPALIDQLAKEQGRLQDDLNAALVKLTGVDFLGNAVQWRAWYEANKGKLAGGPPAAARKAERPQPAGAGRTTSFYGITTRSQAIVFVIDISGSMNQKTPGQPGAKAGTTLSGKHSNALDGLDGGRRIDIAKRELIKAIVGLDRRARFTIIWYNQSVMPWKTQMVQASDAIKDQAIAEIKKLEAKGATNIFDSVERAFSLAGLGQEARDYVGGADTIFLLSDGAPNRGRIIPPDEIVAAVAKLNATRKLTIHTIGIGTGHNEGFMRKLAEQNGGKYVGRK